MPNWVDRLISEIPSIGLVIVAVLLVATAKDSTLTHDAVLAIVTGLLGYMKGAQTKAPPQ